MIKERYTTATERTILINGMKEMGKSLIEDAINADGKFLFFIDPAETEPYVLEPMEPEPTETALLGQQLVEKDLQILELQTENQLLGQQIVDIDLRLLTGGM